MRARKARAYREQRLRERNRRLVISGIAMLLCLVLVVVAVRGVVGCVSNAFAPKQENAEQPAVAQEQEPITIEVAMIGDILQHAGVYESGFSDSGSRNYDHIFAHIGSALEGADLKVVNQETVLGGEMFEFSGYPEFNGPQEMGDAEAKAGFNVILRATNHALDMGYEGLSSELSFWHAKHPEVTVIGAVDPEDSSASVDDLYVYEKDGFKVALLNYTYGLNDYEDPQGVVSMLDEDHVKRTVKAADAAADMVVVFPHWGEEYKLEPVQSQRDMAKILLDAGADVIIGGHPHVIEPVEILTASDGRKVPCFWSVGNFISTQADNENLVGGIAKVTMTKDADGTCSIAGCSFEPTVTHKGYSSDMTTYLLRDYTDTLAKTNYLESNETDNTSLTVSWANDFCTKVLGSGFSPSTGEIAFGAEEFVASSTSSSGAKTGEASDKASTGSSDESSSVSGDSSDDSGSYIKAETSESSSKKAA